MSVIYALRCPKTFEIRYIGYTSKEPNTRLKQHISSCKFSKREQRTYRAKWINSLLAEGYLPNIKVLTTCDSEKIKELEILFIAHYKQFCKLTNGTSGGDGSKGHVPNEEARQRMRKAWKPRKGVFKPLPVDVYEKENLKKYTFSSKEEAAKFIKCSPQSIADCIIGRRTSVYGYICKRSKIETK